MVTEQRPWTLDSSSNTSVVSPAMELKTLCVHHPLSEARLDPAGERQGAVARQPEVGQPLFRVLSPLGIPYPPQPSSSPPTHLVWMLVFSSCSQMFTSMLVEMSSPSPPRTLTTTWRPDCRGMTWGKEREVLAVPRPSSWPKDLPQCHLNPACVSTVNEHDLVDFRCGIHMVHHGPVWWPTGTEVGHPYPVPGGGPSAGGSL